MCSVLGTWTIKYHKKKYYNFISYKADFDLNAKVIYILKSLNHVIVYYSKHYTVSHQTGKISEDCTDMLCQIKEQQRLWHILNKFSISVFGEYGGNFCIIRDIK